MQVSNPGDWEGERRGEKEENLHMELILLEHTEGRSFWQQALTLSVFWPLLLILFKLYQDLVESESLVQKYKIYAIFACTW